MKQFYNAKDSLVTDAIDGLIATTENVARLDGYPHIKVIIRTDWDKSKVALVSGGGSGHEPAHAGFIGEGMLTAAVCGDVFASPSVDAVLAGILAVTGEAGCLLIVKNYTGDRLNFGLAAERARARGLDVNMVVVDDDIALPDLPQARGVAGTLFVHKVVGAMAENGSTLTDVTDMANKTIAGAFSIGMSLDTCTIPGSPKEDRIVDGKAELGLGIHGEPGVEQVDFTDSASAMAQVADRLSSNMDGKDYVALLNNLGGTTPLEMSILTKDLLDSSIGKRIKYLIGPAPLMTSLDMRGFSVSLLAVNDENRELLLQAVGPSAWPAMATVKKVKPAPLPDGLSPIMPVPSHNAETRALVLKCCDILIKHEKTLNALDAQSGDGDTGSTLATAARAMQASIDELPLADHTQLYRAIGTQLSQTMGGSSGVLLAIFFAAAGDSSASGQDSVEALKSGLERVQQVGGASLGDRTMIDSLHPALVALSQGLEKACAAAREGANLTATMGTAKAGRSSYVSSDKLMGHNDPGAEAIALLLEGLSEQ